jgi:hypothetical protein
MPIRRFCLIVWGLTVVAIAGFALVVALGPNSRFAAGGVLNPAQTQYSLMGEAGKEPSGQSKAARALRFLTGCGGESEKAARWLAEYRDLTAAYPDLRPVLAARLFQEALGAREHAADTDAGRATSTRWMALYNVIGPTALDEVAALRHEEPDNALWPVFLLMWELNGALQQVQNRTGETPPPIDRLAGSTFVTRDPQALRRARELAQQHATWESADWQAARQMDLQLEFARERGLGPGRMVQVIGTLLPHLAHLRHNHRQCLFLGYEALTQGNRDEARLWFETGLAIGRLSIRPNNCLVETLVSVLVLQSGYDAMRDWHASGGDFLSASRMGRQSDRVASASKAIQQASRERFAGGLFPKADMQRVTAAGFTMLTAAGAAVVCVLVTIVAAVHLAVERRGQRRAGAPAPPVRWRLGDTLWTAGVALLPVLLFAVALACFPPEVTGDYGKSLALLAGSVALAAATLLAGLSCRRAWTRIRAAGGAGSASPLWPLLALVGVGLLAALVLLGDRLALVGVIGGGGGSAHPLVSIPAGPGAEPSRDSADPFGSLLVLTTLAVLLAGAAALVIAAVKAARRRLRWGEGAVRTAWLVRAFSVAALVLVLFFLGSAVRAAARFDAMCAHAADMMPSETEHYLGPRWIDKYFKEPASPETQSAASAPATQAQNTP